MVCIFAANLLLILPAVDHVQAKSFKGGKSFKMGPSYKKQPAAAPRQSGGQKNNSGSISRGLMGGMLGGAMGAMLFGSLFGMGGQGMGILPLLLLAAGAYFLFRRAGSSGGMRPPEAGPGRGQPSSGGMSENQNSSDNWQDLPGQTPDIGGALVDEGLLQIRRFDPGFDSAYFKEVASDVFFQVQAGWMRRDLDSYRHLLGDTLAAEYAEHFVQMKKDGIINKVESVAVRGVEITQAGSDGKEDFVTIRFTASLLDYKIDDSSGEVVSGSPTTPIKFDEEWTWARPTKTQDWRLEGIH